MPLKYSITLKISQTNEEISSTGELTNDECELLQDFVKYADELFKTPFIQKRDFGGLEIKSDGKNVEFIPSLPDWNDAELFIHKLRPFVLQDEATYFHKIRKFLGQKFTHAYFRGLLSLQKNKFNCKNTQNGVEIKSDGEIINSEKMLLQYLYAHQYHKDKDKQKSLEELHHLMPLDASKIFFLRLLLDKAQAIFCLADFIDLIFGKYKQIEMFSEVR